MRNLAGMFAEGRGVDQDLVQAWTLLNIGAERGDAESAKARDALSEQMRPGQLAAGERRTEKLAPDYPGPRRSDPGSVPEGYGVFLG